MAIRSIKTGATGITEAGVLQHLTDMLKASGVLDITTTMCQVAAASGLNVSVAVGRAYLLASGGNGYPVIIDATVSQAVNSNASGNPRITSIVLYKNLAGTANTDDTNTTLVTAVDGTPAGSPSAPSSSTIQSAVGAGNPWTKLADVTVASGASTLAGQVADKRTQATWRTDLFNSDAWVVVNATGATTTLDLSLGKKFQVNLQTAATTFVLLNVPLNCKSIEVRITQANGGNSTVIWWGSLAWPGGSAPTLSTTNAKSDKFEIDFLTVTSDSVNTSEGAIVLQNV